jgi:hypothetical protein
VESYCARTLINKPWHRLKSVIPLVCDRGGSDHKSPIEGSMYVSLKQFSD